MRLSRAGAGGAQTCRVGEEGTANEHLDEAIRQLQTAIEQGKQGKGDAATDTVERALAHLSEGTTPASGHESAMCWNLRVRPCQNILPRI